MDKPNKKGRKMRESVNLSRASFLAKVLFCVVLALSCFVLTACGGGGEKSEEDISLKPFVAGEKLTLTDVTKSQNITLVRTAEGFVLDGKDEKKSIMFDIFATYCPPCQKEAPHLMDFGLKNSDDFKIVGLISFEEVTDEYVVEKFVKKYGAYYFIANNKNNERLINQILRDISYKESLQIPFKVVLSGGTYQTLTDNLGSGKKQKFYLGEVSTEVIKQDFLRIKKLAKKAE